MRLIVPVDSYIYSNNCDSFSIKYCSDSSGSVTVLTILIVLTVDKKVTTIAIVTVRRIKK